MRILMALLTMLTISAPAHARMWTVEKDGSGDFTIIQDAIDASADGDTILVGPGRYDTFRQYTSTIDGFTGMTIAWVNKSITLLGAGRDLSIIGPEEEVLEIDGLNPGNMYLDGGGLATVKGFTFEKTLTYVGIRKPAVFEDNRVDGTDKDRFAGYGLFVGDASGVEIRDIEFLGPGGVFTANFGVGSVTIERCTFRAGEVPRFEARNAIATSAQGLSVRDCTFEGVGVSISNTFGGTALIEDCELSMTIGGVSVDIGSVVARNLTIGPAEQNVRVAGASASIELYDCELRGGSLWTIDAGGDVLARSCTILNIGGLSVRGSVRTTLDIDLRYNYWGTTDVELVRSWIDDPGGSLRFEPILQGPVSAEPQSFGGFKSRFRN